MKAEYDLGKLKARKNSYTSKLKRPVTMRLSDDVLQYFKGMAGEVGVPYQSLINLYLRYCLATSRKMQINWSHGTKAADQHAATRVLISSPLNSALPAPTDE